MAITDILLNKQDELSQNSKPLNIVDFAKSKVGLGVDLYPAQRFLFKIFYGLPLLETIEEDDPIIIRDKFNEVELHRFSEKDFLNFLYNEGRINLNYEQYLERQGRPYIEVLFAIGRRGSKTFMVTMLTGQTLYDLLRLEDPHGYFNVLYSDYIGIAICSNSKDGAKRHYNSISNLIANSPFFNRYFVKATAEELIVETRKAQELKKKGLYKGGYKIRISCFGVSASVRGDSNIVVILDEFGHYRDSDTNRKKIKPLDRMMYEALTPSISGFVNPDGTSAGKKFIISSPNGCKGMLYEMYENAKIYNQNILAVNTPSHWVNLRVSKDEIKDYYNKSELSARQEFGGEFISNSENYLNKIIDRVYACVDVRKDNVIPKNISPNINYYLGIDLGLSWDGCAFAVGHLEKIRPTQEFMKPEYENMVTKKGEIYVIDYIKYLKPIDKNSGVLAKDEVLTTLKDIVRKFRIKKGIYDQWSGELWTQLFAENGLRMLEKKNATQQLNSEMAMLFYQLVSEGRLILPNEPTFIDELFSLKESVAKNGLVKVENTLDHDDMYDAVCRALFLCFENKDLQERNITMVSNFTGVITPNSNFFRSNSSLGNKASLGSDLLSKNFRKRL